MRKSDKKKNIQKANLLAEQRYLESKGIIKEGYDEYLSNHSDAPYNEPSDAEPDENFTIDFDYKKGAPVNTTDDLDMISVDFNDSNGDNYSYSLLELLYPNNKEYQSRPLTSEEEMVGLKMVELINSGNIQEGGELWSLVDDILGNYIDRNWSCCMEPISEGQVTEEEEISGEEKPIEIPEKLKDEIMNFLSQQRVSSAAQANDNKAVFYRWLEMMWSPENLHYGADGNEIRTNNPKLMSKHLDRYKITGKRFVK